MSIFDRLISFTINIAATAVGIVARIGAGIQSLFTSKQRTPPLSQGISLVKDLLTTESSFSATVSQAPVLSPPKENKFINLLDSNFETNIEEEINSFVEEAIDFKKIAHEEVPDLVQREAAAGEESKKNCEKYIKFVENMILNQQDEIQPKLSESWAKKKKKLGLSSKKLFILGNLASNSLRIITDPLYPTWGSIVVPKDTEHPKSIPDTKRTYTYEDLWKLLEQGFSKEVTSTRSGKTIYYFLIIPARPIFQFAADEKNFKSNEKIAEDFGLEKGDVPHKLPWNSLPYTPTNNALKIADSEESNK